MIINWWAVLAAAALNMLFGFLWYGPIFGTQWMRAMNVSREELSSGSNPVTYLIPLVGAVTSAVVLATVIAMLRVYTWWSGMAWGALLWFAFGATGLLTTGVFENRKMSLSWLFIGYMVLVHAAQGAMFAVWR